MRIRTAILNIFLPITAGLILVGLAILGSAQARAAVGETASLSPEEAAINPIGAAYEVNIDSAGHLWISDYGAGEIWQVDPTTGVYTAFVGIRAPTDARRHADGNVWWSDGFGGGYGRLDPATGVTTWWTVPGSEGLIGTQIDSTGDFWVTGWDEPNLYHFELATSQLCTYTLPLNGSADYPQVRDGAVWLGDWNNNRLLQLDPEVDEFTAWDLPADSSPLGMAFDSSGALWYADFNNAMLARFHPATNRLDTFDLPTGSLPVMVAPHGNSVWYTEQHDPAIGRLNPNQATGNTITLTPMTIPASLNCALVTPPITDTAVILHGTLDWVAQSYPTLVDNAGWLVFGLPETAFPWGLAAGSGYLWFVDSNRHVLARLDLPPAYNVYLPLVLR